MKNIVIAVCIIAALQGCALAAKECDKLLNCKVCADESHCESCPDGYVLNTKSVCVIDCAAKFGKGCPYCTSDRCVCPDRTQKYNSTSHMCEDEEDCDSEICSYCGFGFDLFDFNGKCSTCDKVFGEGCAECTESHCTAVTDENAFRIVGAIAVAKGAADPTDCSTLYPGCTKCNSTSECSTCGDKAELDGGFCKFKMPTCESGQKPLYIKDSLTCGTCQTFDENCVANRCSGHGCTMCKTGFAVTSAGGCVNCSSSFTGCGMCQEDACTKCRASSWILTPNGCFNQNPYIPPDDSNGGMIAGIVVAVIVVVVLIVLAVYCVIASTAKHGEIDPSLYEDDVAFNSVSVL